MTPSERSSEARYWWADRLAPTLVVEPLVESADKPAVALGDCDAPFILTAQEAREIGAQLLAAASAAEIFARERERVAYQNALVVIATRKPMNAKRAKQIASDAIKNPMGETVEAQ